MSDRLVRMGLLLYIILALGVCVLAMGLIGAYAKHANPKLVETIAKVVAGGALMLVFVAGTAPKNRRG